MASTSCFDFVIGTFVEPVFPNEVPKMSEQEHRDFVSGLLDGSIFTTMHIHQVDKEKGDIAKVFIPQGTGVFSKAPESFREELATLWEFTRDMAKTGMHRGTVTKIDYPKFLTCRVVGKDDWDRACDAIKQKKGEQGLVIS